MFGHLPEDDRVSDAVVLSCEIPSIVTAGLSDTLVLVLFLYQHNKACPGLTLDLTNHIVMMS